MAGSKACPAARNLHDGGLAGSKNLSALPALYILRTTANADGRNRLSEV